MSGMDDNGNGLRISSWSGRDKDGRRVDVDMYYTTIANYPVESVTFALPPDTVIDTEPDTGQVNVTIPFGAIRTFMGDWVIDRRIAKLEDLRDDPRNVFEDLD